MRIKQEPLCRFLLRMPRAKAARFSFDEACRLTSLSAQAIDVVGHELRSIDHDISTAATYANRAARC